MQIRLLPKEKGIGREKMEWWRQENSKQPHPAIFYLSLPKPTSGN
jgi:hypothetical protein